MSEKRSQVPGRRISSEEEKMLQDPQHLEHADMILSLTQDENQSGEDLLNEQSQGTYEERLARKQQEYQLEYGNQSVAAAPNTTALSSVPSDRKETYQERFHRLYGSDEQQTLTSSEILALTASDSDGGSSAFAVSGGNAKGSIKAAFPSTTAGAVGATGNSMPAGSYKFSNPPQTSSGVALQHAAAPPPPRSTTSSSPSVPRGIRLMPSMVYPQTSKQTAPTDGAIPGAYAVHHDSDTSLGAWSDAALAQSGNEEWSSTTPLHNESFGDSMVLPTSLPERDVTVQVSIFGTYVSSDLQSHHQEEGPPSLSLQDAEVEQASPTIAVSERKGFSRKKWWLISLCTLCLVAGAIAGLVVGLSGSSRNNENTAFSEETLSPTATPTLAPTSQACLDAIYQECLVQGRSSFSSGLPGCVAQRYAALRSDFLSSIDVALLEMDETSCVPENLALLALSFGSESPSRNKYILSVFHFSTNGPISWTESTGWLSEDLSECQWYGIVCHSNNKTGIVLANNNLRGRIPSMIGLLTSLGELILEANALTSTLPEELGNLSLLFALSFKGNDFDSSPFPTLLLQLTDLRSLLLSELSLSGTLPAEIASLQELRELDLSHNSLTGPLPTSLFSLLNLQRLLLGENKFNGTIPSEIGSLSQINGISIDQNNFSGALPTEIGLLSSLKTFAFSYNQFSGLMSEYLCSIGQTLETFGDYLECTYRTVDDFYGGLQCPSAECCYNCPMAYSG